MTVFYILFAIFIFGFLIFIHELGHFIAAKKLGVQVNEFAICMGPVLWKKKKGETTYSIRAIPVGGFCAMEGEDQALDNPRAFTSVSWWRRLIILAAGSFMNFLAGFLVVAAIVSMSGGFFRPIITGFFDGGGLEAQGLQVGDEIIKIDGEPVYLYDDVSMLLSRGNGVFDLVVRRGGEKISLPHVNLQKGDYELDGQIVHMYGINFGAKEEQNLWTTLRMSWFQTLDFIRLVRLGLQDLVTGAVGINDMSGPVGIVNVMVDTGTSAESASIGFLNVVYLAAFIAVNLAVMNLLPLPALDGGRIVCLLLTTVAEKFSHRKLNPKYEGYLHGAGLALLLVLMAYVTFHDAFNLVRGWFA